MKATELCAYFRIYGPQRPAAANTTSSSGDESPPSVKWRGFFGISEACLHRWLKIADQQDGVAPEASPAGRDQSAELREAHKRRSHCTWWFATNSDTPQIERQRLSKVARGDQALSATAGCSSDSPHEADTYR